MFSCRNKSSVASTNISQSMHKPNRPRSQSSVIIHRWHVRQTFSNIKHRFFFIIIEFLKPKMLRTCNKGVFLSQPIPCYVPLSFLMFIAILFSRILLRTDFNRSDGHRASSVTAPSFLLPWQRDIRTTLHYLNALYSITRFTLAAVNENTVYSITSDGPLWL